MHVRQTLHWLSVPLKERVHLLPSCPYTRAQITALNVHDERLNGVPSRSTLTEDVRFVPTAYHCKCVDPWLTKTKKTCPVCKQKVVPSQGDSDSDTDSSQEENEVSEHTPLLRPLASVSAQSFGALSESHSHQNMTESSDYEEEDNEDTDSSDAENEINEHSVVVQLQANAGQDYSVANTV